VQYFFGQEGIIKEKEDLSENAAVSFCVVAALRLTAEPQLGKKALPGCAPTIFQTWIAAL
jgi:hypothetical protein